MVSINVNNTGFTVSNAFVDKYLCEANGSFVKVYLYLLRHAADSNITVSDIANALNLLESDVIRSFKYWDKQCVLSFKSNGKDDYSVEFIPEHESNEGIPADKNSSVSEISHQKNTSLPTAVMYTKSEITNYMKTNEGIRHMFLISSQILNRTLSDTDRKILFSFYDYLKMPVEVIFTLLEYCASINKTSIRYIEKVAYSWADREINTLAKASAFVKERTETNNIIRHYLGVFKIIGRDFTETELSYLNNWLFEMKYDESTIRRAYEVTVTNTGKLAFSYMDKVLKNSANQSTASKDSKLSKRTGNIQKRNSFQDYSTDMDDFDIQLIQKRIGKS